MLLIASFFLYSAKTVTKTKTTQGVKQVQTSQQEMKQVTSYVQSCLDATLKKGLEVLGKQGGYIGNNYNTPYPKLSSFGIGGNTYILADGFEIRYGILRSSTPQPPIYPTKRSPYGPNPNAAGTPALSGERNFPSLDEESDTHSFHNHLKAYVMSNIGNCLDFSIFNEEGLDIAAGELSGELTIAATNIVFALNYPLDIRNRFTNEQTVQSTFSSTQNIRLGMIHSLMSSIIQADVNNITFDISSFALPEGIFIQVVRDAHNHDDLIILKDSQSPLNGKPYELQVGRQNRMPALHYVSPKASHDYLVISPSLPPLQMNTIVTITVPTGSPPLTITKEYIATNIFQGLNADGSGLKADDPDEDTTSFTYAVVSTDPHHQLTSEPLIVSQIQIVIQTSDGALEDYQSITINKA